jgi:hypothetical protein
MKPSAVTRHNLHESVAFARSECSEQLEKAKDTGPSTLLRDLNTAMGALQLISKELMKQLSLRPKHQRSAAFTRYVIDEGANIKMDDNLVQLIVRIEAVHQRCEG